MNRKMINNIIKLDYILMVLGLLKPQKIMTAILAVNVVIRLLIKEATPL